MKKTALAVVAHPDDAEFQCAGTLALLRQQGWEIVIATMTPGQAGSDTLNQEEISATRRKESANSVNILNGTYECLEKEDIFIMYDRSTLSDLIRLLRKYKPSIVFTASPSDYIVDHEITSMLTQTACLAAGIRNIQIDDTKPVSFTPYLYYCEPMQGMDKFGKQIKSSVHIDISSTIDIKEKMLCCHDSQRAWLRKISNVDDYVNMMKDYASLKGRKMGVEYAEGFRQHLGYSYPQHNILETELSEWYINDLSNDFFQRL